MASSTDSTSQLSPSSSFLEESISSNSAHIEKRLADAEELKTEATEYFRNNDWSQALATYRSALGYLPKKAQKSNESTSEHPNVQQDDSHSEKAGDSAQEGLELQCAKLRSILNANIGACYVKLGEHKEAVKACTSALSDDPHYVKALQRRASSNEKIASWSSLASARDDYNTLLKLLPPDSQEVRQIQRTLRLLTPRVEEQQKRETGEMMDKLKGMGDSILGNFGLSTDNFKFVPNGQGGYSVNFER